MSKQNLAEIIDRISKDQDLSATRMRDLRSDILALSRLSALPLESIVLDADHIRELLNGISPIQAQISEKRLQNIRSSLSFCIRRYQVKQTNPLSGHPLTPEWQRLYDALEDKQSKNGLSGFFRYCSLMGEIAFDIYDDVVARYYEYVKTNTLRKKPDQVYRNTCRLWNRAVETLPEFVGLTVLSVPSFKRQYHTQDWTAFPATLQSEVEVYLEWLSGKDLLSENRPPHICKPSTLRLRNNQLRNLASAAVHAGFPIEELTGLSILASEEVTKLALGFYLDRNNGKSTPYIRDLTKTLKRIAQHWIKADEGLIDWYRSLINRLDNEAPGLTEKNRETLRQFDDPENVLRLLELPDKLVRKTKSISDPYKQAQRFLYALAIEILIYAPMRIGNLTSLRLDKHIVRPNGKKGQVIIALYDNETKNGTPQEYPLPPSTRKKLDAYLKHHRLHLMNGHNHQWLFPDKHGKHKSEVNLSGSIKKVIYKNTGLNLTAHQFRHLSAKLILEANPGAYELARRVLNHKNVSTTVNFYAGLESKSAVAHYDQIVLDRKQAS